MSPEPKIALDVDCTWGCDQGQIVRPSLAVLRGELEQVGWWVDYAHELVVDDDLHPTIGESWEGPSPAYVERRPRIASPEEGTG